MKTLLLIEDNTYIRENTCELLELEGYHVINATNGKSGLIIAKEIIPDAILCDIMMPEADGYEVFNTLKSDPLTTSIPFIFLTASCEKKEVDAALGMGVSGYIRKPFEPKDLFDVIENCLNKR
jgi:CheY-like chemotaxis protein